MIPQQQPGVDLPFGSAPQQNILLARGVAPPFPAHMPLPPSHMGHQFVGAVEQMPYQIHPPMMNGGYGSYMASPARPSGNGPCQEMFHNGYAHSEYARNGFPHANGAGSFSPMMTEVDSAHDPSMGPGVHKYPDTGLHDVQEEMEHVPWTTPSPGSRLGPTGRFYGQMVYHHEEDRGVGHMEEPESPSGDILPAEEPGNMIEGAKSTGQSPLIQSDVQSKSVKGAVRRKPARKAVYKCLRDIVDRAHLVEPGEEKLAEVVRQLREAQQGDGEFIDSEWVQGLWGKVKQDLLKEVKSSDQQYGVNGFSHSYEASNGGPAIVPSGGDMHEPSAAACTSETGAAAGMTSAGENGAAERKPSHVTEGWEVGSKIEAQDSENAWYRAEVMALSFTRRQVNVKFAGWDEKWNEWIHVQSGRVRAILNPEAKRIRKDGTPIMVRRSKGQEVVAEASNEEAKTPMPSREEARALDRTRRKEEEEKAKEEKLKRKESKEEKKLSAMHLFLQEEILRLCSADVTISVGEARKLATKAWKDQQTAKSAKAEGLGMEMGMIIGSVHQIYVCNDEETPEMVAGKLGVDVKRLVQMNSAVYPHLKANKKLMQGTMLKLPGRTGSGGNSEVTLFAKVQGSKTLVLNMREGDKVKALKRLVHNMEGVPVKEMAVLFAGQKLDENATLSDYNIRTHCSVHVQVGSVACNDAAAAEVEEVEYDSGWMQSNAGQKFLATADGERWLKTTAGKLWKQEVKAQNRGSASKPAGDSARGMSAYNLFIKNEVSKMRALHPEMHHRTAWQRVAQLWRMHESPDAPRHRAEWGAQPSVVTWNSLNVVNTWTHHLQDAAAGAAAAQSSGAADGGHGAEGGDVNRAGGSGKKRKKDASLELAQELAQQFSSTYDWSYREQKLSRTAKKAARISLTTDTLEMLTCELEGMDDRYDGSGWTTFRKPVAPAKPKAARKPKAEGDGRKRKAADGKEGAEVKGKERKEQVLPRWFRGVPRCPELQLDLEQETLVQAADMPRRCAAGLNHSDPASAHDAAVAEGGEAEPAAHDDAAKEEEVAARDAMAADEEQSHKKDEGAVDSAQQTLPDAQNQEEAKTGGGEAAEEDWLPLPASMDEVQNTVPGMFRLPYPQVREMLRMEFEDAVCADDASEFPTPFVAIRRNKYVHEKQASVEEEEDGNKCQCIFVPGMPETACGALSNCMLRDLFIECSRKKCPCGKYCLNQRLQRSQWAKCSIFKASDGRGWCLKTDEELAPGQLAVEYIGEVVSGEEVNRRASAYKGKRHTYLLKLNQEEFIDSTRMANLARFINHCCEPNCEMQKWRVGQEHRVGLFAKYRIPAGSELTFDYDMEFYGSEDIKCLCGAPKCRGTLGRPKEDTSGSKTVSKAQAKLAAAKDAKKAERAVATSEKAADKKAEKQRAIQKAARGAIAKAKQVRRTGGKGLVGAAASRSEMAVTAVRAQAQANKGAAQRGRVKGKRGRPRAQPPTVLSQKPACAGDDGSQAASDTAVPDVGGSRRRAGGADVSDRILAKVLALSEMECNGAGVSGAADSGVEGDPFGLMSPAERRQQEAALKAIAKSQQKAAGKG